MTSAPSRPGLLFAANAGNFYRSEDWGDTWAIAGAFQDPLSALQVHPSNPDLLLGGATGRLMQSRDGGRTWHTVWTALDAGPVSSLLFHPGDANVAYAIVRGYGLVESGDGGASWRDRLSGDFLGVAVTRSRNGRVYLAAGFDGVYRQRSPIRWPWLREWEYVNSGLRVGPSGFSDRAVSIGSWLLLLTLVAVSLRLAAPGGSRRLLARHPWETTLAIWAVVTGIVIVVGGMLSQRGTDEALDTTLLASLSAVGVLPILLKAPSSWATYAIMAGLQAVEVTAILLHLGWPYASFGGTVLVVWVAGLLVGLAGSALLIKKGRMRLGKLVLVSSLIAGNAPQWLLMLAALPMGGLR